MKNENHDAQEQARAQYDTIRATLDALDVNFDRLQELQDMDSEELTPDEREELAALLQDAGEFTSEEEARDALYNLPLSVEYRSGWVSPGAEMLPEEFCILLCTGGPAVRIIGELDDYNNPRRAYLECQDWGTPWTQYHGASSETLRHFASLIIGG
jgi:hypothetical protein